MTQPRDTHSHNIEEQLSKDEVEPLFQLNEEHEEHDHHGLQPIQSLQGSPRLNTEGQDTMTEAQQEPEQRPEPKKGEVCAGCIEMWPEELMESTQHCYCSYCFECWIWMIESHLRQRQILFCCGNELDIPERIKEDYPSLYNRYQKLREEIYAVDAMYCATRDCSIFLGDIKHDKVEILCQECGQTTCASCRNGMTEHKEGLQECPEDTFAKEVKGVIAEFSYQKCPTCQAVVEKIDGCDSIECVRCRTTFCYGCGDKLLYTRPCSCRRGEDTPELEEAVEEEEDTDDESLESINMLAIDLEN